MNSDRLMLLVLGLWGARASNIPDMDRALAWAERAECWLSKPRNAVDDIAPTKKILENFLSKIQGSIGAGASALTSVDSAPAPEISKVDAISKSPSSDPAVSVTSKPSADAAAEIEEKVVPVVGTIDAGVLAQHYASDDEEPIPEPIPPDDLSAENEAESAIPAADAGEINEPQPAPGNSEQINLGGRPSELWSPEKTAELLRLRQKDGLSFGEIAQRLGPEYTKNAVIGKAARLGLNTKGPAPKNGDPPPLKRGALPEISPDLVETVKRPISIYDVVDWCRRQGDVVKELPDGKYVVNFHADKPYDVAGFVERANRLRRGSGKEIFILGEAL